MFLWNMFVGFYRTHGLWSFYETQKLGQGAKKLFRNLFTGPNDPKFFLEHDCLSLYVCNMFAFIHGIYL